MNNYDAKKVNKIIDMSYEIACKFGRALVKEDYYTDWTYGHIYEYESLKIEYCEERREIGIPEHIEITINGVKVLYYNYTKEKLVKFKNGRWTELIDTIYDGIDILEMEKKAKEDEGKNRLREIIDFEKVVRKYISFTDMKSSARKWFDEEFEYYNMKLVKVKRMDNTGIIDDQSGDFYCVENEYFDIYYNDEKVLTFKKEYDSPCGHLRTENGVYNYEPGYWMSIFKDVVERYEDYREKESSRIVDDSVDDILRKLRNRNI